MPRRGVGKDGDRALARATSVYGFTSAQRAIARRLVDGQSLKQIAHGLRRHRRTVADHVRELKRKTGSRTLPELVFRICTAPAQGDRVNAADTDRRVCEFARRHDLTATQAVVLRLLLGGTTISGIAQRLGRHPTTVKGHIHVARRKAGAGTCVELAAATMQQPSEAR